MERNQAHEPHDDSIDRDIDDVLANRRGDQSEQIPFDRLFEAAEASLRAMRELAELGKFSPTQIHGSPLQPDELAEFSSFEIAEAEAFLRRMGIIVPAPRDD